MQRRHYQWLQLLLQKHLPEVYSRGLARMPWSNGSRYSVVSRSGGGNDESVLRDAIGEAACARRANVPCVTTQTWPGRVRCAMQRALDAIGLRDAYLERHKVLQALGRLNASSRPKAKHAPKLNELCVRLAVEGNVYS